MPEVRVQSRYERSDRGGGVKRLERYGATDNGPPSKQSGRAHVTANDGDGTPNDLDPAWAEPPVDGGLSEGGELHHFAGAKIFASSCERDESWWWSG